MADEKHIEILKGGMKKWNAWRENHPEVKPNLRNIYFYGEFSESFYDLPRFDGYDFSNIDFHMSSFRNAEFINCCFDGSAISFSDLVDGCFSFCSFENVTMRVTKIGSAIFNDCVFRNSDLSYCSARETSFKGSKFINSVLEHMSFVSSDFSNTLIENCYVYGISSWDLKLENSHQKSLVITQVNHPSITVDNIELAQFIYLIINNKRLRDVIDTITSKVVLVLGNFSPERKKILDILRDEIRKYNYVPVLFDFKKPSSRNLTETIFTLAHMSKFVIADISSARSIGHELSAIVPRLQSVNFYPIIIEGESEYGMFEEFSSLYWVKPIKHYKSENILQVLGEIIESETSNLDD